MALDTLIDHEAPIEAAPNGTTPPTVALQFTALEVRIAQFHIVGDGPLMVHAWSTKAIREMEDAQQGKGRNKKEPKNPQAEYEAAFYRLPDGTYGIPARAFKKAIITAATHVEGLTKTFLRTAFHVTGDAESLVSGRDGQLRATELVRLRGSEPVMRTDMVRVGGASKTADVRYRPEWAAWECTVTVRYNACSISIEQLTHLFNLAGFGVGICEWRPEKDGQHGLFHVARIDYEEVVHHA